MATTISQGSSATITLAATDQITLNSALASKARIENSTVKGFPAGYVLKENHHGSATYGPFGAGNVIVSALVGSVDYVSGTAASIPYSAPVTWADAAGLSLTKPDGTSVTLNSATDVTAMFPTRDLGQVSGTITSATTNHDMVGLLSAIFQLETVGNLTLQNPANLSNGMEWAYDVKVGGSGNYTLTLDTTYFYAIGGADPVPLTAGQRYYISCQYNSALGKTLVSTATDATRTYSGGFTLAVGDEITAIATGTAKVTYRCVGAWTLTSVRASLSTAQTSGSIFTVNVKKNGTTIFSTKITIDNTETTSVTAATPAVLSTTTLADDDAITVDVDQIGDGTAKGLKVTFIGTHT